MLQNPTQCSFKEKVHGVKGAVTANIISTRASAAWLRQETSQLVAKKLMVKTEWNSRDQSANTLHLLFHEWYWHWVWPWIFSQVDSSTYYSAVMGVTSIFLVLLSTLLQTVSDEQSHLVMQHTCSYKNHWRQWATVFISFPFWWSVCSTREV